MKISIITPCFNSGNTIRRTIDSVVNQIGDFELEYIIIDGKSTDNTLDIIKEYADKYNYIKYKSEKDNSMTEALNKGLKMVTGDIVASINADDEYLENALKNISDYFIKNSKCKVVTGNCYIVDDNSKKVMYKLCPKHMTYLSASILDCTTSECHIFYKKECIDKLGLFNENIKYTQDYEFYLRLLKNGVKFDYVNEDLAVFYMSDGNYSTVVGDKMKDEVKSYVEYKFLHNIMPNKLNQLFRVFLGIRKKSKYINLEELKSRRL